MSLYAKRGVSAQKEEVHEATRNIDKGLYPNAFCKVYKDSLGQDDGWVNIMHADGAGTKSILAYLYWKETGDLSVWKGIAQDAIVMNLDDLICVGIHDHILFSSSIDRNKSLIPGEVLKAIIEGTQELFDELAAHKVGITFLGGETADVGDVVRTIAVNGTMAARWKKDQLITNDKIAPGNVIVGLASFGQTTYEGSYNSGIGSNGLTSARHDVLNKSYSNYPETFDPSLADEVVYIGQYKLQDKVTQPDPGTPDNTTIGNFLLSPTRTYAPVLKAVFENHFGDINGLIHCSGGGQTKCMNYMPQGVRIIKDALFEPPRIFRIIQEASGADEREMFQVFNMGCRMEIYTNEAAAAGIISTAQDFRLQAKVIGRVEQSTGKELVIKTRGVEIRY